MAIETVPEGPAHASDAVHQFPERASLYAQLVETMRDEREELAALVMALADRLELPAGQDNPNFTEWKIAQAIERKLADFSIINDTGASLFSSERAFQAFRQGAQG